MDNAKMQDPTITQWPQPFPPGEFDGTVPEKRGISKHASGIVLIALIAFVAALFLIHANNTSNIALGSGSNTKLQNSTSSTSVYTTIIPASSTIIQNLTQTAPDHTTVTTTVSQSTVSTTIPSDVAGCPCPGAGQIAAMLGISQLEAVNVTFNVTHSSNATVVVQKGNSSSASQQMPWSSNVTWTVYYATKQGGSVTVGKKFTESVVATNDTIAASAFLTARIRAGNQTLLKANADDMNYSYFNSTSGPSHIISIVGSKGNQVASVTVIAPQDEQIASVSAIAQNISAALG